jgi:hypothetical protein
MHVRTIFRGKQFAAPDKVTENTCWVEEEVSSVAYSTRKETKRKKRN